MKKTFRKFSIIAQDLGAVEVFVEHSGKHPKLIGTVGSRQFKFVMPSSPSDHRWEKNAVADLKRIIAAIQPSHVSNRAWA